MVADGCGYHHGTILWMMALDHARPTRCSWLINGGYAQISQQFVIVDDCLRLATMASIIKQPWYLAKENLAQFQSDDAVVWRWHLWTGIVAWW